MRRKVTDYLLYRWRFIAGYSLIGLGITTLLVIAGIFVPGGLSAGELQSATTSFNLSFSSFDPAMIIQLPYHLLQQASINLFGLSNLSIKLPSLLLGLGSAVGMLLLLKAWFRPNISILTTILVITTGQFLYIAQSGTASILYIFWSIWLLVSALMVSRHARRSSIWKIALFGIAALSLYTPLGVYILIALASAVALHPHLRYLVRRMFRFRLRVAIAATVALVILLPLLYGLYKQPSLALTLLGIPDAWPHLLDNAGRILSQYFDFVSPSSGELMKPVYGLGPLLLIILGIFRLVTTNYTARSYIITTWSVLLIPVLLINPNFISITFVPAVILMAMGLNALLGNWYNIFPKNPYARIAGLIPLTILVGGMVFSGAGRYIYGYTYDPNTAGYFSQDLRIVNTEIHNANDKPLLIITTKEQQPFYAIIAAQNENVTVKTALPKPLPEGLVMMTRTARAAAVPTAQPTRIITDNRSTDADRFYLYEKADK